jgi:MFS family permease
MPRRPLGVLTRDGRLLLATRVGRTFAYGALSVVLVLYLAALGLDDGRIGLILALTLLGDAGLSLFLTTRADSLGRGRVLRVGALLMIGAGLVFAVSNDFWVLLIAATIGVISVTGGEIGPFRAIEEASLSHILPDRERTRIFGWYSLVGSFAGAAGALVAGLLVAAILALGASTLDAYRAVVVGYAVVGAGLLLAFALLTPAIEVAPAARSARANRFGLHRSSGVVARLSVLFSLDSFGGALAAQSIIAYWFAVRFAAPPELLGAIFFVTNILAGLSALVAARLAARIGLVPTMVFTHLPSNVMLVVLPFMPSLPLAAVVLFVFYSLNKMDVPARQSYIVSVVDADERSAAGGITSLARSLGQAPAPAIAVPLVGMAALAGGLPFVAAGVLKISYDLLLWRGFRALKPPEESGRPVDLGHG